MAQSHLPCQPEERKSRPPVPSRTTPAADPPESQHLPPRQSEAFADQRFPNITTPHQHAGEGAPITVLSLAINSERTGAEEGGQVLLGLEAGDQLRLAPGAKRLRRVDIGDPHPLEAVGGGVTIHDDEATAVEGFGASARTVRRDCQDKRGRYRGDRCLLPGMNPHI